MFTSLFLAPQQHQLTLLCQTLSVDFFNEQEISSDLLCIINHILQSWMCMLDSELITGLNHFSIYMLNFKWSIMSLGLQFMIA